LFFIWLNFSIFLAKYQSDQPVNFAMYLTLSNTHKKRGTVFVTFTVPL